MAVVSEMPATLGAGGSYGATITQSGEHERGSAGGLPDPTKSIEDVGNHKGRTCDHQVSLPVKHTWDMKVHGGQSFPYGFGGGVYFMSRRLGYIFIEAKARHTANHRCCFLHTAF